MSGSVLDCSLKMVINIIITAAIYSIPTLWPELGELLELTFLILTKLPSISQGISIPIADEKTEIQRSKVAYPSLHNCKVAEMEFQRGSFGLKSVLDYAWGFPKVQSFCPGGVLDAQ